MTATAKPEVRGFFDEPTNTVSYLIWDPATKSGAVIDPVLNFDHRSGEATVESADALLAEAKSWHQSQTDPGDPCPCRSFVGRALHKVENRCYSCDQGAYQGRKKISAHF